MGKRSDYTSKKTQNLQSQEVYRKLIKALLNCSDEQRPKIFDAHLEIIDTGFIQTMEQVAFEMAKEGDESASYFLRNFAAQLAAQTVWMELLKATYNNSNRQQVVYSILDAHQGKLNNSFAEVIENWAIDTWPIISLEQAVVVAGTMIIFSDLIMKFPRGSKSGNLEIALTCCQSALQILTKEAFPELWAMAQQNLGNAYCNRIRGDRAENIEQAINCHQNALLVHNYEAFVYDWASIKIDLGNAYYFRVRGKQAENIELSIHSFNDALQVLNQKKSPELWAMAQNNLANSYGYRIFGDVAENIEQSIICYENALQVYTFKAFPELWAMAQQNLAGAYGKRRRGNKADNQEQAISCYENALQVYTREVFPEMWALVHRNLVCTYCERIYGIRAENIERAIIHCKNSLQVRTREAFPQDWAMAQNSLANAYLARIYGERIANLEQAFACYNYALQIYIRETFPNDWALIQSNLTVVYKELQQISKAIQSAQLALEIYTPTSNPLECFRTGCNLGIIAFTDKRWSEAIMGFSVAIEAVETNRSWTTSESRRQQILEEANIIYMRMVQACINASQLDKAIETVERSRSKSLVDLMASNDLYSGGNIPSEVQELLRHYEDLQKQIDSELFSNNSDINREFREVESSIQKRAAFQAYNEAIATLEIQKTKVFEQIRKLDPVLAGGIQVSVIRFDQMQRLIDQPNTAILSFYTTTENTYIFVLRQNQSTPYLHTCIGQGIETLQNKISLNWSQPYLKDKSTWQSQLNDFLAELAQRLQIDNLIDHYLQGIEELILVPHLLLHQIPLAALPIQDTEHSYLGDKFQIRYVPSCQVLEFCQEREHQHPIGDSLQYGVIANATEDLPCASFEAEKIANLFNIPKSQILQGRSEATKNNYRQLASKVQVLHSCHHAESRLDKPLESILKLADETLTLGELLTPGWRFPNLSDVCLSCCETGLGIPKSLSDEIMTLSTGFLCAGARSVISTLWSVDDLATALFFIFYYQNRQQGKTRPQALQYAQKELRSLTQEYINKLYLEIKEKCQNARKNRNQYPDDYLKWNTEYRKYAAVRLAINKVLETRDNKPFSHPRYWAAFTCSGLR